MAYVLAAYTVAALVLILYEVKLWAELRSREREVQDAEAPQDASPS